ncbi:MAG: excinuclease ABC subunit UvrC [Lachnospiraceae bacterium]|nr:excinuclease ABC subunit UvrC [Lachnospiraceae bacterium]
MFDLEEELKKLPDKPGVYIMHDASDAIIYVGKAVSLKNRVRQYFQTRVRSPKIERMISLIDHFEYIVVGSEMEALVLECNLIKENRPKYNTMLMDDKTYPFIKVTVKEAFPRVFLTRKHVNDGARYFGPYTNVEAARNTLEMLNGLYHTRKCRKAVPDGGIPGERACLYHHMKQCDAPCVGAISSEEYKKSIEKIVEFLDGNSGPIVKELEGKMKEASAAMEFEKAAEYRDLISDIKRINQVQRVTSEDEGNRDVVGMAVAGEEAVVQVFFIRGGKLVGKEHYYINDIESESRADILNAFVKQYYSGTPSIPKEILLCEEIPEAELIGAWLSERAGAKIYIRSPKRGEKEGLIKLANSNASGILIRDGEKLAEAQKRTTGALEELAELLDIPVPERIEAYDISHISGFETVGSMVVYENGRPKPGDYRKFRIRTVTGPDDYASLAEVLTRRFEHGRKEIEDAGDEGGKLTSFSKFPDIIMMDGGRGQVNVCLEVFEKLGLDIRVCGLVKDDSHRTRGIYYNNIEVPIDTGSEAFKLITRVQDEVHRFAIEYHRMLRSKEQVHSILDDIEGIGPVRRRALMRHFESLEAIRSAGIEELAGCENMNMAAAEAVYAFFRKKEDNNGT